MRAGLVIVLVVGCGSDAHSPDGGLGPDAGCSKVVHGLELCAFAPQPPLVIESDRLIDSTSQFCTSFVQQLVPEPEACLIFAESIAIRAGAQLGLTGQLPVILASDGDVAIEGTLDVSGTIASGAAGSIYPFCPPLAIAQSTTTGAGGGAGGSFGVSGGDGGLGGAGGAAGSVAAGALGFVPSAVRGGCPGMLGGIGPPGQPGLAGTPGGGVWVFARGTLTVSGSVIANGTGGGGSSNGAGGSGGASGGFVLLAGSSIVVEGGLFANGGAGGEGGAPGVAGVGGANGASATTPAAGGTGTPGGDGGAGGAQAQQVGGDGAAAAAGGGGGGGAAGIIAIDGPLTFTGVASPMFSTAP